MTAEAGSIASRHNTPFAVVALALVAVACSRTTGTLSDEEQRRLETEGIVRQAVDLDFRRTHDVGRRDAGWEEMVASIVVTRASVLLYDRDRVLLAITPRSTGEYDVTRDHERLSLHAGRGGSARSWSFRPPDDPQGWAEDIRTVIRATAGEKRRPGDDDDRD